MKGFIIRKEFDNKYLGVDSYNNQEWIKYIPDWNTQQPDEAILINDAFECYISSQIGLGIVQRFHEWMKQKEEYKQSKLLFFQSNEEAVSMPDGYVLLGYDVAFIEDPEYWSTDYFYSSVYHELCNSRIIAVHDSMHTFRNKLNESGLFNNSESAASYLKCRNELFIMDLDNLFETAYDKAYNVVRIMVAM
ncbi:hypothetical protein [Edaphocola aurantiacus]|uniref:hypothetical protein n=1 Tax=Edaphocola aurantiacus TaxID=2601682 RepID=UPI001C9400A4|nr:hypothetical protein [Edaphocola aurantiacus]